MFVSAYLTLKAFSFNQRLCMFYMWECVWVCVLHVYWYRYIISVFGWLSVSYVNKWYMYVMYCKWNEHEHELEHIASSHRIASGIWEKYAIHIIYKWIHLQWIKCVMANNFRSVTWVSMYLIQISVGMSVCVWVCIRICLRCRSNSLSIREKSKAWSL